MLLTSPSSLLFRQRKHITRINVSRKPWKVQKQRITRKEEADCRNIYSSTAIQILNIMKAILAAECVCSEYIYRTIRESYGHKFKYICDFIILMPLSKTDPSKPMINANRLRRPNICCTNVEINTETSSIYGIFVSFLFVVRWLAAHTSLIYWNLYFLCSAMRSLIWFGLDNTIVNLNYDCLATVIARWMTYQNQLELFEINGLGTSYE